MIRRKSIIEFPFLRRERKTNRQRNRDKKKKTIIEQTTVRGITTKSKNYGYENTSTKQENKNKKKKGEKNWAIRIVQFTEACVVGRSLAWKMEGGEQKRGRRRSRRKKTKKKRGGWMIAAM